MVPTFEILSIEKISNDDADESAALVISKHVIFEKICLRSYITTIIIDKQAAYDDYVNSIAGLHYIYFND